MHSVHWQSAERRTLHTLNRHHVGDGAAEAWRISVKHHRCSGRAIWQFTVNEMMREEEVVVEETKCCRFRWLQAGGAQSGTTRPWRDECTGFSFPNKFWSNESHVLIPAASTLDTPRAEEEKLFHHNLCRANYLTLNNSQTLFCWIWNQINRNLWTLCFMSRSDCFSPVCWIHCCQFRKLKQ